MKRSMFTGILWVSVFALVLSACAPAAAAVPTAAAAVPTIAAAVPTVAAAVPSLAPTVAAAVPTVAAAVPSLAPTVAAAVPTAAAAVPVSGAARTYVLVPKNLGNPYFDTANKGAQEAAKALGVTVQYNGPATADATQQIQLLNSLIAQKVSGLAISADDPDALVPTGQAAMTAGIPVVSWDSGISKGGDTLFVNQADTQGIGAIQIKMALDETGPNGGKIAILSATSSATNQNAWIAVMKTELQKPENSKLQLVDTVYGNDDDTKSYTEAQGLLTKYPDLKVIIAPTTVGIAAAARAVKDGNLIGKVFVTGLGTPNQMRDYVKNGACPEFALWNPADLGYLTIYALDAIATGKIKGQPGDKFTAGRLGSYTVQDDPKLGSTIILGPPTIFNKDNIDKFNF
jgi:rhamnose transport system substrate-binding protein